MKVSIIGAGIAGLTLGLACQRAGIDVNIYDQAKELRTIGGGILLWPHGLRFLNEFGLADSLRSAWMSVSSMNIVGHRGQQLVHEDTAEIYSLLNGEILPIDRSRLQQLLVAQLAPGSLHLDKTCVSVVNHSEYARVIFSDGTDESSHLIVGADGINSAVRHAIYPAVTPQYAGFCWWGGIVDSKIVPHLPVTEAQFILGQGKMCYLWPTHGACFMWYLPVKMTLASFQQADDHHMLAQQLCHGWNADVQRIITAPQQAQRFHLPIFELPPQASSSLGRVTLIGDAASATGPLLGQGANRGIEDAYLLTILLQQHGDEVHHMLSFYDNLRRARHERIFELEQLSASALIQESPQELEFFEAQIPHIDLVTMYQDMIPLVNDDACTVIANAARQFSSIAKRSSSVTAEEPDVTRLV